VPVPILMEARFVLELHVHVSCITNTKCTVPSRPLNITICCMHRKNCTKSFQDAVGLFRPVFVSV
jgi:hypothetical protein